MVGGGGGASRGGGPVVSRLLFSRVWENGIGSSSSLPRAAGQGSGDDGGLKLEQRNNFAGCPSGLSVFLRSVISLITSLETSQMQVNTRLFGSC